MQKAGVVMRNRIRKAIEAMYDGSCTVTENVKVKDLATKQTNFVPQITIKDQPCHISYKSAYPTGDGNTASLAQEIKLFIAPEIKISAGSKIEVTQNGKTTEYTNSGEPQVYKYHQEISLKLFERWA
ncbi:MAG: hypothetical protein E7284_10210 [Lachnospiraceae bacterium]|nr:hypothetical protein [Lachnospiraceae bacterium]